MYNNQVVKLLENLTIQFYNQDYRGLSIFCFSGHSVLSRPCCFRVPERNVLCLP